MDTWILLLLSDNHLKAVSNQDARTELKQAEIFGIYMTESQKSSTESILWRFKEGQPGSLAQQDNDLQMGRWNSIKLVKETLES